jgi:hypothetical protein
LTVEVIIISLVLVLVTIASGFVVVDRAATAGDFEASAD